ncbi:hypothetical protein [Chondrinema litorale]|uniref:hypothetical protein n=1 Tax=Chondrinema litorale TaxID=2994555 RepID=UPI0025430510|nr:hypothetical protein [Chondrinema litorale]UZR95241.1 hypothetical protein OQ292_05335 [Chondrinema litorale]
MEKSIESIWKEGFLKTDNLNVPKVNNLYNQKSIHIIEKMKTRFDKNLKAIVIGAVAFLVITFFLNMLITGIIFFVLLIWVYWVNKKLLQSATEIDNNANSFQYLKAFYQWLNQMILENIKLARVYYPLFFLAVVIGGYQTPLSSGSIGELVVYKILMKYPDTNVIFGLPLFLVIGISVITALLAFFADKIYRWDFNIVYGTLMSKIEEVLQDMKALSE